MTRLGPQPPAGQELDEDAALLFYRFQEFCVAKFRRGVEDSEMLHPVLEQFPQHLEPTKKLHFLFPDGGADISLTPTPKKRPVAVQTSRSSCEMWASAMLGIRMTR